ncbi:MAG: D-alanyl-D-alanine carboxypeptidase, partial [Bacteroidota bacterium]|nr:D-alanyl-D-alanine carboxypeptidase [Bacteroidota bacterium]
DFYRSLPESGNSGTLKSFCKNTSAHGKIKAKSGSMSGVKSYAGYITTNSQNQFAFSIIINNYDCPSYVIKKKIEKLVIAVVEEM